MLKNIIPRFFIESLSEYLFAVGFMSNLYLL